MHAAFTAYRKAVLTGNGDDAARLLSASTHGYYDLVRRLALYADANTVRSLSLMNQMQVLTFRARVPAEQLEAQDSAALIAHAVSEGWIGKNSVRTLVPGEVQRDGDQAILLTEIEGYKRGPSFRFAREEERWKLDLVPAMKAGNVAFVTTAKQRGISQQAFLRAQMKQVLGHELREENWTPPRSRP